MISAYRQPKQGWTDIRHASFDSKTQEELSLAILEAWDAVSLHPELLEHDLRLCTAPIVSHGSGAKVSRGFAELKIPI